MSKIYKNFDKWQLCKVYIKTANSAIMPTKKKKILGNLRPLEKCLYYCTLNSFIDKLYKNWRITDGINTN